MKDKNFNGFASEAQYEAVANIVINAIDKYTNSIAISCNTLQNEQKNVEVDVETESGHNLRYHIDSNGVFYVNTEGENFPIQECKILVALNGEAGRIFDTIGNIDGQENLKKFLCGDNSVLRSSETVRDLATAAKANLDNAINTKTTKIHKDIIKDTAIGVFLWRDEDIIPVIEEHYGIHFKSKGNSYYYFEYAA